MADCHNCTEKCPQAEMAHEIAKGRMYVTQEFVELVKKIESGQLVEVVRCIKCEMHDNCYTEDVFKFARMDLEKAFCCLGKERRTNADN